MNKGMINSVVFLDIRKAFDTVDHKILPDKLSYYGREEDELSFFKSYLSDRTQRCSINGVKSKFRSISCGVLVRSILGTLLFIIYMNDLPNSVKGTKINMYADDTNLTKQITSLGDVKVELIPEIEKVILWLKANKLSVNTLKTEFMFFGSSKRLKDTKNLIALRVGDKLIRRKKKVKYIGVILDEQLTWGDHIDYISTKIKRNIGAIKRIRNSLQKYLEMLHKAFVEPHFRYCNTLWGPCGDTLLNRLQTLQNRAARVISFQKYDNTDHKYLLKN